MKPPRFWRTGGPLSVMLAPLGWGWAAGAALRGSFTTPWRAPIPVVCIGNLVAGGAGKTPVALSVAHRLSGAHFLSRGYGGSLTGPVRVDPDHHDYLQVGDEPLLLARLAPCWVAQERAAGARAAALAGASCLVMDDGYQDPSIAKDISLLVVDGHVGFGAGRCMPAGPLRESLRCGLRRADAVVILGDDRTGAARQIGDLPILRGRLEPENETKAMAGRAVVAFAGIGRPEKFFHMLESQGAVLTERRAFPDHHRYSTTEIAHLIAAAEKGRAVLVTTSKDYVRVPAHQREHVAALSITVTWEDEAALMKVLAPVIAGRG